MNGADEQTPWFLFTDQLGRIFEADPETGAARLLHDYPGALVDLGLSPDGQVYGLTFSKGLQLLDPWAGEVELLRSFDDQPNALTVDRDGFILVAYGGGLFDTGPARIDVFALEETFPVAAIDTPGPLDFSAGALVVIGDEIFYADAPALLRVYDVPLFEWIAALPLAVIGPDGLLEADGRLLGIVGSTLYEFDKETGAATFLHALAFGGSAAGSASFPDGVQRGTEDADEIIALLPGVSLRGGDGDDALSARPEGNALLGEAGDDVLTGGDAADLLAGGGGDDDLSGGGGDDRLRGGKGEDVLRGEAGADRLIGGAGADALDGGEGDDALRGNGGGDLLLGGAGDDVLAGGGGRDRLEGEDGDDLLAGGRARDRLLGGNGNDRLEGGGGKDRLRGGEGDDVFVFAPKSRVDRVLDWTDDVDLIAFAGGPSGFDDLRIAQRGVDATIDYDGDGGRIILKRTDADALGEDDFLFG